jgi:hypothetical protein
VNSGQDINSDVAFPAAQAIIANVDQRLVGTTDLVRLEQRDIAARVPTLAEFCVPNFLAVSMLWLSIFATALPQVKQREGGCLLRISIAPPRRTLPVDGLALGRGQDRRTLPRAKGWWSNFAGDGAPLAVQLDGVDRPGPRPGPVELGMPLLGR